MKAFKVYPFTLSSLGSQVFPVAGSFVKIKASLGDVGITLDDVGPFGPLQVGQGFNLAANPVGDKRSFTRIVLTDQSGSTNSGQLIVADVAFIDQTLSGVVSTIDGGKQEVKADQAFMYSASQAGAAGVVPGVLLFNPNSSGKRLLLKSIAASVDTANAAIRVGHYNSAVVWNGSAAGFSKRFGTLDATPVGSSGVVLTSNTGAVGAPIKNVFEVFFPPTNQTILRTYDLPFVIEPNAGLAVDSNLAASTLTSVTFQWTEEAYP